MRSAFTSKDKLLFCLIQELECLKPGTVLSSSARSSANCLSEFRAVGLLTQQSRMLDASSKRLCPVPALLKHYSPCYRTFNPQPLFASRREIPRFGPIMILCLRL